MIHIHDYHLPTNSQCTDYAELKYSLYQPISEHLNNKIASDLTEIKNTYNSDIFGFLDSIYKHDYKTYEKIKSSWYEKTLKDISIKVNTDLLIIEKGNALEEINEKNK